MCSIPIAQSPVNTPPCSVSRERVIREAAWLSAVREHSDALNAVLALRLQPFGDERLRRLALLNAQEYELITARRAVRLERELVLLVEDAPPVEVSTHYPERPHVQRQWRDEDVPPVVDEPGEYEFRPAWGW